MFSKSRKNKKGKKSLSRWWLYIFSTTLVVAALAGVGAVNYHYDTATAELTDPLKNDFKVEKVKVNLLQNLGAYNSTEPSKDQVAAAIKKAIVSSKLPVAKAEVSGIMVDAFSGDNLWNQNADKLLTPASTMKLLTAFAAVNTLDLSSRISTPLKTTANPGELVLVGQGDVTISAASAAKDSYYRGAARLNDLVKEIKSRGQKVSKLIIDNSYYKGAVLAPGWYNDDVPAGNVAPMSSLMLDGGRDTPVKTHYSHRTNAPASTLGLELAARLGLSADQVEISTQPVKTTDTIMELKSPTLQARLREMLLNSDNVLAESIGREIAVAKKQEPSFSGAVKAVKEVLAAEDINLDNMQIMDCSGLSEYDKLTPRTLQKVIYKIFESDDSSVQRVLTLLPVAGVSGTLKNRFTGANRVVVGNMVGKTGSLDKVSTLVGVLTTKHKRPLVFALMLHGLDMDTGDEITDDIVKSVWEV